MSEKHDIIQRIEGENVTFWFHSEYLGASLALTPSEMLAILRWLKENEAQIIKDATVPTLNPLST